MDIKFSSEPKNSHREVPAEKKKQGALVLLLFILIGGFAYLYFFTGLIKPQEAKKTVEASAALPQIVKMPLPPRDAEMAKPKEGASPKPAVPSVVASTASAVKPVAPPPPPPPPAVRPAAVPAVVSPVKVAPTPSAPKPKEESNKSAVVKPAEKLPQPATAAEKKTKKVAAAKSSDKKSSDGRSWSIIVGDYILEEALSADLGRVRKSGFAPIVKPGSRKKSAMNRLFVSEFKDRSSAASTLEKLQRLTSDAFVIEQGGKFLLYAGSYVNKVAATAESVRLKEAGYATTLKSVDIAIPTMTLSVGPFANRKAADAARGKLQSIGLKVSISQQQAIQCQKK